MSNDERICILLPFCNDIVYIRALISDGIDLNLIQSKETGDNLLHIAVKNKNIEIIKLLLECDVNYNTINNSNEIPLDIAIKNGSVDIVEMFLMKGIAVNQNLNEKESFLYNAVQFKHLEIVKKLCQYGANIEYKCIYGIEEGFTPLILASKLGEIKIVEFFKSKGANINAESAIKTSAIYHAVEENHIDIVKKLIAWGANMKFSNRSAIAKGFSLLHVACKNGNKNMVKLLLQNNVQIDARARNNKTPLHIAIENQHIQIVKILLSNGANVNDLCDTTQDTNLTALHLACKYKDVNIISAILSENININARYHSYTSPGATALHLAILNLNPMACELLLKREAEIDYVTVSVLSLDFRFALLILACQNPAPLLIRLLLCNVIDEKKLIKEWIPSKIVPVNLNNKVVYLARDPNNQEFYTCEQIKELIILAKKSNSHAIVWFLEDYLFALNVHLNKSNSPVI